MARYPSPDGLVFTSEEGKPIRWSNFKRRVWAPAVAASVREPLRFHDLRHSHVALLIAQGDHPKVAASRLGHTSVNTVLDRYGHLFEGLDEAAADRLEGVYRSASVPTLRPLRPAQVFPLNPK